ncbi:Thioesterase/thiol ester dehydrase-isomerase [Basidiobolus meristosporus CBS 931.73]|uniref:Thioesterase/thiol ester dehydrase-isomerase n=1 Tax=Basidiobolus meristosporus CBS 931.73 TaxID=1314790 RepID=A0A1Y1XE92_9FUNG|nr:Thioesterase/thiol ester dehydrase-isomerase [Basidiobolus meristosporus CBS 931.73]|eukprot:ORX84059.1 Thioesterase/thiol ester dehydrase-isomerase [Basidiobolus meristosporus CBS 931.73]
MYRYGFSKSCPELVSRIHTPLFQQRNWSRSLTTAKTNVVAKKPAYESRTTLTETILPSHTDDRGFAYGGQILSWIDIAAGIAAKRHASVFSVTRSMDSVHFLHPVSQGDILILNASVNRAWNTSMEVGVRVETEDLVTGKRTHCCYAYLTFVALNPETGKTTTVPKIIPETESEKKRYEQAEERRQRRLSRFQPRDNEEKREIMNSLAKEEWKNEDLLIQSPESKGCVCSKPNVFTASKTIQDSYSEVVELVLPQDANTLQITFGGKIMQWIEYCAIISASRHSRSYLITASVDTLQFYNPTYVGDIITIRSFVSGVFNSSLEVSVVVEAESPLDSTKRILTNDAYVTIVSVDKANYPYGGLPALKPRNEKEERYIAKSVERRANRLQERLMISKNH